MAQQNVTMQLLLEIRQFRAAWGQAQAAARQGGAAVARSAQTGGAAMGQATKKASGFAGAINFLKTRVIGAGLFFAAFYQGLITFRKLIGDAVGELFNLDDALRRVQSITKQSDESIAHLKGQLLDAAKAGELFDQTAGDVADAMFNIAQAGFDAQQSLHIAKIAAEGAAVGFTTAEVASRVLIGVLKAYDRPVEETRAIMNTLFQTVDTGIVTFEDLATGLGKVLSSAAALEIPLEEVTAAVATLTLRGFTAEQAMTGLGRIMQTFIRPSQRAKKAAAELGIELSAQTIATHGLIGTMEIMFEKTDGNVNKFATLFDRIQSTRAAVSLFKDDGELLNLVLQEMGMAQDGVGAAALAMAEREKSVSFQLAVMRVQMLAVTTEALEPLLQGMGKFAKTMNSLLAGENQVINFLVDLKAIIFGVAGAFLFMQSTAIIGLFAGIVTALQNGIIWFGLYQEQAMLMRGAMLGLMSVAKALAPLLIFMGIFAFKKLLDHMSPIAGSADRVREKMSSLREAFVDLQAAVDRGVLDPDKLRLQAVREGFTLIADAMAEEYIPALEEINAMSSNQIGLTTLGAQAIGRMIFNMEGWSSATNEVRKDLEGLIENELAALFDDLGLTTLEIENLGVQLRIAGEQSFIEEEAMLFGVAAGAVQKLALRQAEVESISKRIRDVTGEVVDNMGDTIPVTKEFKGALDKVLEPIKKAQSLLSDILGLTSRTEIIMRAKHAPLLVQMADNNVDIERLKGEQLIRERELIDAGFDLDTVEDGILTKLGDQIEAKERTNEETQNIIDQDEALLAVEEKIDEQLESQLLLLGLQIGRLPALLSLTDEEQRILGIAVGHMTAGGPALQIWIDKEKEAGRVLDDIVLEALLEVVNNLESNVLDVDVENALAKLGIVHGKVDRLTEAMFAIPVGFDPFEGSLPEGQHGLRNFMGGLAMVGEAGPEIVRLPRGSDVIRNEDMRQTLQGASATKRSETNLDHVSGEGEARATIFIDELHLHGDARAALDSLSLAITEPGV